MKLKKTEFFKFRADLQWMDTKIEILGVWLDVDTIGT
jgi:hypothetical protein